MNQDVIRPVGCLTGSDTEVPRTYCVMQVSHSVAEHSASRFGPYGQFEK